jgi:hypothetical protein
MYFIQCKPNVEFWGLIFYSAPFFAELIKLCSSFKQQRQNFWEMKTKYCLALSEIMLLDLRPIMTIYFILKVFWVVMLWSVAVGYLPQHYLTKDSTQSAEWESTLLIKGSLLPEDVTK